MSMMVRTNKGYPPDGFQFEDKRIGVKRAEPGDSLDDLVKWLIQIRTSNPRIYNPKDDIQFLLYDFVKLEVATANCARLGNNPEWCYDPNYVPEVPKSLSEKCKCGVPLQPRYCATCGGNRVIGYLCPKCLIQYDT